MAAPRDLPAAFIEDGRSVYWNNGIPPKDYSRTTKFEELSQRLKQLVQNKKVHSDYQPDLLSPIWDIPLSALNAIPTRRIQELSVPKRPHPEYQQERPVISIVPRVALHTLPSERLCRLAAHKTYQPLPLRYTRWEWEEWQRDNPIGYTPPSSRICELALHKNVSDYYCPPRSVQWDVSKKVQSCIPSERVVKLARPKNRHLDKEDYDPYTYTVSQSALLTQPSPRINELATPLPRKVNTKK